MQTDHTPGSHPEAFDTTSTARYARVNAGMGIVFHAPLVHFRKGTHPAEGHADHVVDRGVDHDPVNGIVKYGRTKGIRRGVNHLTPHAHLYVSGGNQPVEVCQTCGHAFAGAADSGLTPAVVVGRAVSGRCLKLNPAGKSLAGHEIEVDPDALSRIESALGTVLRAAVLVESGQRRTDCPQR